MFILASKKTSDYYKVIPDSLHKEADALIDYVRYFPYQFPTECPYCAYHSFRQTNHINTAGQPRFVCYRCKKNFSQLTGTYFAQMKQIELWPDFICLRLAGISLIKIQDILGMSNHAVTNREKVLRRMIKDLFPSLAEWWLPHHQWQDRRLTQQVKEEKKTFISFLDKLVYQQTVDCPECGNKGVKRVELSKHRPYFVCHRCKTPTNLLKDTAFFRLDHMELWHPYVECLVKGESNLTIQQQLDISHSCALNWRKRFIKQMQTMGLNELVYWIKWQWGRRQAAIRGKANKTESKKISKSNSSKIK